MFTVWSQPWTFSTNILHSNIFFSQIISSHRWLLGREKTIGPVPWELDLAYSVAHYHLVFILLQKRERPSIFQYIYSYITLSPIECLILSIHCQINVMAIYRSSYVICKGFAISRNVKFCSKRDYIWVNRA